MRVRAPLHSIDVRGRFGVGPVFSIWRGLNYARLLVIPDNPRSDRQLVIRGLLTTASRAWAALSDGERAGWEVYAQSLNRKNVFGQDLTTSGFNEYCSCFVLASDVGETPSDTAPTVAGPLLVTDGAIAQGAGSGQITATWSAGQGGFVDVWITALLPAGRAPQESDYAHNSYTADATATKTISGLTAGGKYSVRIRQVFASGQYGPWTVETLLAKS